jgi:hypothetical protein
VSLAFGPAEDGYRLEARADSAGEVIAALTGSGKTTGGTLVIAATGPSEAGPFDGRLEAKKIFLTEHTVLARILSLSSLEGLTEILTGSHLEIQKVRVDLAVDNGVLQLRRGRINGSGFLISLGGSVNLPKRQVLIHGAAAPWGRFQRFLSRIPVIGRLVTGWNRAGLIATNFTISGPFDDVDVGLAPMSTLTPGILRDVFGISGDPELDDGDEGAEQPETGQDPASRK